MIIHNIASQSVAVALCQIVSVEVILIRKKILLTNLRTYLPVVVQTYCISSRCFPNSFSKALIVELLPVCFSTYVSTYVHTYV